MTSVVVMGELPPLGVTVDEISVAVTATLGAAAGAGAVGDPGELHAASNSTTTPNNGKIIFFSNSNLQM